MFYIIATIFLWGPVIASQTGIPRDSSGVPAHGAGTRDQPLRMSAWEASPVRVKFQQVRMALKQWHKTDEMATKRREDGLKLRQQQEE